MKVFLSGTGRRVPVRIVALVALFVVALSGAPANAATTPTTNAEPAATGLNWQDTKEITTSGQQSYHPILRSSANGAQTHLLWMEDGTGTNAPWQVNYSSSTDQGRTWSSKTTLFSVIDKRSSTITAVAMAVDSQNRVHALWSARDKQRNPHIYYSRSDANGVWPSPLKVVQVAQTSGGKDPYSDSQNIDIAVDPDVANLVHVVWKGANGASRTSNWGIYYANSTDGGQSWGNFTSVSTLAQGVSGYGYWFEPNVLAEPSGNALVVWAGKGGSGVQSNYGTWDKTTSKMTWKYAVSAPNRDQVDTYGHNMALARDPRTGLIHMAYQSFNVSGGTTRGVAYAVWDSQSKEWAGPKRIAEGSSNTFFAGEPTIAVDTTSKVYIAYSWRDGTAGHGTRVTASADGGANFKTQTNNQISTEFSHHASLRFVAGQEGHDWLQVAYAARPGSSTNYDIFFARAKADSVVVPPTITTVTPAQGSTQSETIIRVKGTGFAPGLTVTLGTTTLTDVLVDTSDNATFFYATVPAGIAPGVYDLIVTNPDGGKVIKMGAFTVTS